MKIVKISPVTRCDNGCCTNYATYAVVRADTPFADSLRLCKKCLDAIVALGSVAVGTGAEVAKEPTERAPENKPKTHVRVTRVSVTDTQNGTK